MLRSADEVRSFLGTGARFTMHPVRFARDWRSDRLQALNPLGVLATGAGVLAVARVTLDFLLSRPSAGQGLIDSALDAVAPFVHYAALGTLAHAFLRVLRSRRPLTDSLAMSLFAGGGPGVLAVLVTYAAGLALWLASGRPEVIHNGLLGSLPPGAARALSWVADAGYVLFLVTLLASLRGLHEAPWWKALVALIAAVVLVGLVFGRWPIDVPFGTRVLVRFHPLHLSIWVD